MTHDNPSSIITGRFLRALQFAATVHGGQVRKGSGVPYLAHLLAVCALVLDHGGDETEAIGALLHDTAEDCGGRAMLRKVQEAFGKEVAAIVEGCSDTLDTPKPPWRPRKEAYVAHLADATDAVRTVACADKLHNLLCVVRDLRAAPGPGYWQRFNAGREDQLWYYRACAQAFSAGRPPAMLDEYRQTLREFESLAGVDAAN